MKQKYRKGIFIVAYSWNNGKTKYLVLKRKLHWKGWEFPKGGIKASEKEKAALARELKEETGKKPLNIKKFNVNGKYKYKKLLEDRNSFIGQTYILYAAEIKPGKIKLDKIEHSGYKWLYFSDAVKKLTWQNQKKCLKIVNKWMKKR